MRRSNYITANMGLYYVCYELSKLGWNVLPTSRNAKGVDLLIYSQDGNRKYTIQIKALSKQAPVPLGKNLDNFIADFTVVCVLDENPKLYYFQTSDILNREELAGQNPKTGYWAFNRSQDWEKLIANNWEVIGDGKD